MTAIELSPPKRNEYWYGKRLNQSNMRLEQRFHADKLRLISRFSLGAGILAGFDVELTDEHVSVSPGLALDPRGRDIVLARDPKIPREALKKVNGDAVVVVERYEQGIEPVQPFADTYDQSPEPLFDVTVEGARVELLSAGKLTGGAALNVPELVCRTGEHGVAAALEYLADRALDPQIEDRPNAVVLALVRKDGTVDADVRRRLALHELVESIARAVSASALQYVYGDNQSGAPGYPLPFPLLVRALDGERPLAGWPVTFRARSGEDALHAGRRWAGEFTRHTDEDGFVGTMFKLDARVGLHSVEVTAPLASTIEFRALAVEKHEHRESLLEELEELFEDAEEAFEHFVHRGREAR